MFAPGSAASAEFQLPELKCQWQFRKRDGGSNPQDLVQGGLTLPGSVPVGDVEVVSQNFARQMCEANAQPSCRNVGPHIKPVSLISLGLCGIADGSLVEIT